MPASTIQRLPNPGFGLGLRTVHYHEILTKNPPVDFFEIVTENFIDTKGRPMDVLGQIAARKQIVPHGVSMSIGSVDPPDMVYLQQVKDLVQMLRSPWVSDHVCWSSVGGRHLHDLLPLPYNNEALRHVAARARKIQKFMGVPLALENPSSYLQFANSTMSEAEFIARLAVEGGCGILLDVNNVYVSSVNHDFDPFEYINTIPADRIVYFHLAGHTRYETHILDTHGDHVVDPVWDLYVHAQKRCGGRPTILEWDEDIPAFDIVFAELQKARLKLKRPGRSLQTKGERHGA